MIIKEYCGELNIVDEKPVKKPKPPKEQENGEKEKKSEKLD